LPGRDAPREDWKVSPELVPNCWNKVHGPDSRFTRAFRKRCEPNVEELSLYSKFVRVLHFSKTGAKLVAIGRMLGVTKSHCPGDFRCGLVQGVAESDESVSVASQTVEFWVEPDWDFFGRLLQTLGVKPFENCQSPSVTNGEVIKVGRVPPFSPALQAFRYLRFHELLGARHIGHCKRITSEIRAFIMNSSRGLSVPQVSERVVDRFGVVVSFEAVERWLRKGGLGSS
jgi:hypothetical protein